MSKNGHRLADSFDAGVKQARTALFDFQVQASCGAHTDIDYLIYLEMMGLCSAENLPGDETWSGRARMLGIPSALPLRGSQRYRVFEQIARRPKNRLLMAKEPRVIRLS